MRGWGPIIGIALAALASAPTMAQQVYRCTSRDGKVTYQEAPCPNADDERKVDSTPANTDFDPSKRDEILRKGEEAGKRLEAREAEEARLRQERVERERQLEKEALEREAARDEPVIIYGGWPNRPVQPGPPRPMPPRPQPAPKTSAPSGR